MPFQAIADLTPLANVLNEESNNINKAILAANSKLAELKLGTEVWASHNLSGFDYGFARVTGIWQLAIRWRSLEKNPNCKSGWETVVAVDALAKRNREQRLDGLRELPQIVYLLKKEVQRKIASIRQVNELASAIISSGVTPRVGTSGAQAAAMSSRPARTRNPEVVN